MKKNGLTLNHKTMKMGVFLWLIMMICGVSTLTHAAFTINLGPDVKSGSSYSFPTLTVNGLPTDRGYAVRIMFTRAVTASDAITLPAVPGTTLPAGSTAGGDKNVRVVNIGTGGATAAQLEAFLRLVTINVDPSKQGHGIMILISEASGDAGRNFYYSSDTKHWYELVNHGSNIPWTSAYNAAVDKQFMSKNGYLVTVTSGVENSFISSLISANTWMAGTRWDISSVYNPATRKLTGTPSGYLNYWYWAAGPEWTGNTTQSVYYDKMVSSQALPTPGITVTYDYANWASGEPNNAGTEYCTHFWAAGNWNDYANTTAVQYYIVEYDDITAGTSGLVGFNSTKSATVNGTPANGTIGSPAMLVLGETLKYTIVAGNASDVNNTVVVRDAVPVGLTVGTISNSGVFNPSTREILWTLSVPTQGTQTITYEATKTSDSTSRLMVNTAYVTSNGTLVKQTNSTYHDAKACHITFVAGANGSVSGVTSQYVEYGQNPYAGVIYSANLGYVFDSWSSAAYTSFKGASISAQSGITNYTAETILGDVQFTANFKIENYTLTYIPNGGADTGTPNNPNNPTTYNVTQLPLTINDLIKTGYTFLGWTELPATSPATGFTIPINTVGNKTLTAHWDIIPYTIEYESAPGGTIPVNFSSSNPTGYNVETPTITLVNPTRDGYTFSGWTGPGAPTPQTSVSIPSGSTENRKYIAHWQIETYTLGYNNNGGSNPVTLNPATYTIEGTPLTFSNQPTRLGYTFTGWTGANGSTLQTSVTLPAGTTGNKNYDANWDRITYTITYIGNGGTLDVSNPTTYHVDTVPFSIAPPTRAGYTFAGWTGADGVTSQPTTIPTGSTGNRTYQANWTVMTYTISYDYNDLLPPLSPSAVPPVTLNPATYTIEDTPFSFNNQPTRTGYRFSGWTGPNGPTPQINVAVLSGTTGNLLYTANWSESAFLISYDYNGGTGPATPNVTGFNVNTPTFTISNQPTRAGYTFTGWTGSNGVIPQTSIEIPFGSTGDRDYTANWTPNGYNIIYNGYGGTTPLSNPNTYNITTPAITLAVSVREGYTFGGWAITSDEAAVTVSTGVTIPTGTYGNLTCDAQWTMDTYNIRYNYSGGTAHPTANPTTYNVTQSITLNSPSRVGYDFNGWTITSDTAGVTVPDGINIPPGTYGHLTCVAKWTKLYSVTYNRGLGTSGIEPSDATWYNYNDAVTVKSNEGSPRMTLTDACFIGWSFNPPAAVITVATAIPSDRKEPPTGWFNIIADTTLYAVWAVDKTGPGGVPDSVPDFDQFKVLYDGNAHTGGYIPVDVNNYNGGDVVTRKGNTGFLTKTNAVFIGWTETLSPPTVTNSSSIPLDLSQGGQTFIITADKTFYAVWAEDNSGPTGVPDGIPDYLQYAVIYYGNGSTSGTVPVDNNLYNSGNMVRVLSNTGILARTNTCFIGWSNSPHAIITAEPAIPSDLVQGYRVFPITASTNFYAVWAEDTSGPDGVPDSIPDYLQITLTYHEHGSYLSVGGALPAPNPMMYTKNTAITIKGNTGNLVGIPADSLVFAGWSKTAVTGFVTTGSTKPADMLMAGDIISAGTTNIDLYVVWAKDRNGNGVPDYNEPHISVDPLHKWPKHEDQGDPNTPGYYPLKPDWDPIYDLVGANAMYAECDMCFVIEVNPDPYRDRVFTLNYLGALTKEMVTDEDGEPLADSYTLPAGEGSYMIKFYLTNVGREVEGKKGALEAVIAGGGRDTSAWISLYNHPVFNNEFLVSQYVDASGRLNLGIIGGSPYLMMSIDGRPWKNAYSPLTTIERMSIDDGVSIWLREPNGCWEMQLFFRTYYIPGIQRRVEIVPTPGITTEPGVGTHFVLSQLDFKFTASYSGGNPLKVIASGSYSGINQELIGRKLENNRYEYILHRVTEPWTITFGPETASGVTGENPIEGLSVWSFRNTLNIRSDIDRTVSIYNMTGLLYKRIDVKAGYDYKEIMDSGIYLIITENNQYKVIIK